MNIDLIFTSFIQEASKVTLIDKLHPYIMLINGLGLLICGILLIIELKSPLSKSNTKGT